MHTLTKVGFALKSYIVTYILSQGWLIHLSLSCTLEGLPQTCLECNDQ